jgi:predicted nucleic acid-binding protein
MLFDTDVLIWFIRGHEGTASQLKLMPLPWKISAVTYIELVQGCRNKQELVRLKKGLDSYGTEILPITPTISKSAIQLIEELTLSCGLQLADALIAATAIEHGLRLLSGNAKHFREIEALSLERFDPDSQAAD